jgi:hypothetical protein
VGYVLPNCNCHKVLIITVTCLSTSPPLNFLGIKVKVNKVQMKETRDSVCALAFSSCMKKDLCSCWLVG